MMRSSSPDAAGNARRVRPFTDLVSKACNHKNVSTPRRPSGAKGASKDAGIGALTGAALPPRYPPDEVTDIEGNGYPEVAVVKTDARPRRGVIQIKDGLSGTLIGSFGYVQRQRQRQRQLQRQRQRRGRGAAQTGCRTEGSPH
jgi:hypothetical protein